MPKLVLDQFLHGGDYNPDQWLDRPDIIDEDFRLAPLAGVNTWSVGIFAWTALEPEEGRYTFEWLDAILDRMAAQNMKAVLATPSGAKPAWMAKKYEEIRRVSPEGVRDPQKMRHNHCYTSPVYREKTRNINRRLAERYQKHPALTVWHLSNEYSGECHCNLCFAAFREWLKKKYTTLDAINKAWWSAFWSHLYTEWEQIDYIDWAVESMVLDWRRFVSEQTADFVKLEADALREFTPHIPITTNLMGDYFGLNYRELAKHLDLISWDSYPNIADRPVPSADTVFPDRTIGYYESDNAEVFVVTGYMHDLMRGLLPDNRPFILMESCPSVTNWQNVCRLPRPGVFHMRSLQAIAHGSDSVQYFQWRKGRGGCESFHGAVVDHEGTEKPRVFQEVAQLGKKLQQLSAWTGTKTTTAKVAILFDWESMWAMEPMSFIVKGTHGKTIRDHYRAIYTLGIPRDVIGLEADFSQYRLLILPCQYIMSEALIEKIITFVKNGGNIVATYQTAVENEYLQTHIGGFPGGKLKDLFGIWAEETDWLYADEEVKVTITPKGKDSGLRGSDYRAGWCCEVTHILPADKDGSAEALATAGNQFYAGKSLLTCKRHPQGGSAFYLSSRVNKPMMMDFYRGLAKELAIPFALPERMKLPDGVFAQSRGDGDAKAIFVFNTTSEEKVIAIPSGFHYTDVLTESALTELRLTAYGTVVLTKK